MLELFSPRPIIIIWQFLFVAVSAVQFVIPLRGAHLIFPAQRLFSPLCFCFIVTLSTMLQPTYKNNFFLKIPSVRSHRATTRKPWTAAEKDAVKQYFGTHIRLCKLPGKRECEDAQRAHPILGGRKWEHIKFAVRTLHPLKPRRNTDWTGMDDLDSGSAYGCTTYDNSRPWFAIKTSSFDSMNIKIVRD